MLKPSDTYSNHWALKGANVHVNLLQTLPVFVYMNTFLCMCIMTQVSAHSHFFTNLGDIYIENDALLYTVNYTFRVFTTLINPHG
jgi:hypothetical protein